MQTTDTNSTAKETPKSRRARIPSDEETIRRAALRCVLEIIDDRDAKPSDRLNAVKTLMDCFVGQDEREQDREIRIRFDDIPSGFAD